MDPPSLKELALQQCKRISSQIQDLGETRYKLIEPALSHLNSRQLRIIEDRNPQICAESDVLWKELIQRDFPNSKPPFDNFRAAYTRLREDKDRHFGAARERLLRDQKEAARAREHVCISITEPQRPRNTSAWRSTTMQQIAKQSSLRGRMFTRASAPVPLRSPAHSPPAYLPPLSRNTPPRSSPTTAPRPPKRPAPGSESERKRKSGLFIKR